MFLHQPWDSIKKMTEREFRLHLLAAKYWQDKKAEALEEAASHA